MATSNRYSMYKDKRHASDSSAPSPSKPFFGPSQRAPLGETGMSYLPLWGEFNLANQSNKVVLKSGIPVVNIFGSFLCKNLYRYIFIGILEAIRLFLCFVSSFLLLIKSK